ncbi:clathrin coat assembly protein AP180 isoform X2 [Sardina pilchardus]|uniref:clathrin coat assembly protein AP180 isoform X2 n=1 Tax=Sardina pilchardus TaxID=27697 RepID=UPI002E153EB5
MSGQTLTDRIAAAQYQLTGSEVATRVCKATTHEVMAPKKKHLDYLIAATNETNVNIPQMADTLFERATNASWVVVFKALLTTHHMTIHGNERFIQYLASRTSLFNLSNFIDKTGTHGYDMSTFIRRYARYLNEKAYAYRQMAFDFTRVKKGAEGVMRTMTPDKLLKAMPALQTQVDTLLEFDVHPKDLNNGIINGCFMLLFKDLIKLFASYNDGIINLLEKYFKMKKSDCKEALEIYKRFLTRVTKIGEFMKIAEQVGVDKNDIPDISYAPSSILESLETHMNSLEGKKGDSPTKGSPTNNASPASTPAKSATSVPTLEPPPTDGSAAAAAAPEEPVTDSLLDLDPLAFSGPSTGASAAPTNWGDLLGSEMGSLCATDSLQPDPSQAVDSAPSPAAANEAAASSLAPPPAAAGAAAPSPGQSDLLGEAFATPAAEPPAAAEGGASAATPTPAADAAAASAASADSAGGDAQVPVAAAAAAAAAPAAPPAGADLMAAGASPMAASPVKPDLDATMANLASNLSMGNQKPADGAAGGANWQTPQVAPPQWGGPMTGPIGASPYMGSQPPFCMAGAPGAGAPMMPGSPMMFPQQPMMRPQFPAAGSGAPMNPAMAQSPRKPPPPKDPLADLNIKDFL